MILPSLALAAALAGSPAPAPGPTPEPLRVECEGPVEWSAGKDGSGRLRLSGGVRVRRGETVLSARSADAVLAPGATSPETVLAEGDVELESPRFSVRADVAEVRRSATPGGNEEAPPEGVPAKPAEPPSFDVTLERRGRAEVELRAGDVVAACLGPLVYAGRLREATLTGGVRAESPRFRARCDEGTVVFREGRAKPLPTADAGEVEEPVEPGAGATEEPKPSHPPPDEERPPAEGDGDAGPERDAKPGDAGGRPAEAEEALPAVERIDLRGGVVLEAKGRKGDVVRRVRAARALYDAAAETVAFTGEPAPVVEYGGVTLTAPEIVLHLRENRVEPRGGKMRAVLGPAE